MGNYGCNLGKLGSRCPGDALTSRGWPNLLGRSDVKTVPLHGKKAAGRVALVDDDDFELVSQYRWYAWERVRPSGSICGPYAITRIYVRGTGAQTTIKMHKLITGWPATDHHNHDGLDNQRSNLRPADDVRNQQNRRSNLNHSSQYKGVCWHMTYGKWMARLQAAERERFIGYFTSETAAAEAYDAVAREAFGEYACLNFPEDA
jgi:hypothetical protein